MKTFSNEEINLLKQVIKDNLDAEVNICDSADILNKIHDVKVQMKLDMKNMTNDELKKSIQKMEFLNDFKSKLEQEIEAEEKEKTELMAKLKSLL